MAKLFSFSCIAGEKQPNQAEFADPTTSQGEESEKVIKRGNRIQKLIKSLSCLLEEEEEEQEQEMVIGFPTDVKHVGHIGWDGSSNNIGSNNNNNNIMDLKSSCRMNGHELLSLDSLSLKQFEAAMASITVAAHLR
ncbi:CRIB domain-containing protein RIC7-like [Zingiber officinale]|uniref:CRIB domain-containing protein RIC7-like n=1 Tax=Zingiber officinale TaxID=94328 RepID=UPI001C4DA5D1|nr:CRIB domain-containing protein RIC7-like [Zingiber officinale]XP_042386265.1 CRIB domain-containing protein RIC7-like [Zingiber officinale]